jgi:predicted PurR-regulated permease PerM
MHIRELIDRNWRLILLAVVSLIFFWALYTWRMTILPFLLGLVLAYILLPIIRFVEVHLPGKYKHTELKRVLAIIIVLFTIMGVSALVVFFAAVAIVNNSADLIQNASKVITNFITTSQQWTQSIRNMFPEGLRESVDKIVLDAGSSIGKSITSSTSGGGNLIISSLGLVFGFAAIPLFLFYLLKDSEKIQYTIASGIPPSVAKHVFNIFHVIENVLGRYFRQELLLGAVVGSMTLIGLLIFGVPFAPLFAVVNGFCEMIPTIGPIIGGVIMAVGCVALAPNKIVLVILLAIIIQLSENNILVPRIAASYMNLHPALIIVLLVLGGYFWGFWGMVLTVPLTATMVEIVKYVNCITHQEEGTCLPSCPLRKSYLQSLLRSGPKGSSTESSKYHPSIS